MNKKFNLITIIFIILFTLTDIVLLILWEYLSIFYKNVITNM